MNDTATLTTPTAARRDFFATELEQWRMRRRARGESGDGRFYDFLVQQIDMSARDPEVGRQYRFLLDEYVRTGTIAHAETDMLALVAAGAQEGPYSCGLGSMQDVL